jgi:hypothetical protein
MVSGVSVQGMLSSLSFLTRETKFAEQKRQISYVYGHKVTGELSSPQINAVKVIESLESPFDNQGILQN